MFQVTLNGPEGAVLVGPVEAVRFGKWVLVPRGDDAELTTSEEEPHAYYGSKTPTGIRVRFGLTTPKKDEDAEPAYWKWRKVERVRDRVYRVYGMPERS